MSGYWEGEERPLGRDGDLVTIRAAPEYYHPEGCKCCNHRNAKKDKLSLLSAFIEFLSLNLFCMCVHVCVCALGLWRRSVCFPGSGPPERRGAAGQSSEDAKFYRARRVGCHLHADKNCGIFTLTRGKTTSNKRDNSVKIELFTLY